MCRYVRRIAEDYCLDVPKQSMEHTIVRIDMLMYLDTPGPDRFGCLLWAVAFEEDFVEVAKSLVKQMQGVVFGVHVVSVAGLWLSVSDGSHRDIPYEDRMEDSWPKSKRSIQRHGEIGKNKEHRKKREQSSVIWINLCGDGEQG